MDTISIIIHRWRTRISLGMALIFQYISAAIQEANCLKISLNWLSGCMTTVGYPESASSLKKSVAEFFPVILFDTFLLIFLSHHAKK